MSSEEKNIERHQPKGTDQVPAGKPVTSAEENARLERQKKLEMVSVHRHTKDHKNQFHLFDKSKPHGQQVVQDFRGFPAEKLDTSKEPLPGKFEPIGKLEPIPGKFEPVPGKFEPKLPGEMVPSPSDSSLFPYPGRLEPPQFPSIPSSPELTPWLPAQPGTILPGDLQPPSTPSIPWTPESLPTKWEPAGNQTTSPEQWHDIIEKFKRQENIPNQNGDGSYAQEKQIGGKLYYELPNGVQVVQQGDATTINQRTKANEVINFIQNLTTLPEKIPNVRDSGDSTNAAVTNTERTWINRPETIAHQLANDILRGDFEAFNRDRQVGKYHYTPEEKQRLQQAFQESIAQAQFNIRHGISYTEAQANVALHNIDYALKHGLIDKTQADGIREKYQQKEYAYAQENGTRSQFPGAPEPHRPRWEQTDGASPPAKIDELVQQIKHRDDLNRLMEKPDPIYNLRDSSPMPAEATRAHEGDHIGATSEFGNKKHQFEKSHGVICEEHNGRLEYHLKGHKEALFSTDNNEKGLDEADKRISKMIKEKEDELTHRYGARFSQDGETAGKQHVMVNGHWTTGTDDVQCRNPKIGELYAVEAALQHSAPNNMHIKFFFTKNSLWKGLAEAADFQHVQAGGSDASTPVGSAAVYINSDATQDMEPTDTGYSHRRNRDDHISLQYNLVHELVHHSQDAMGWDTTIPGKQSFAEREATEMGWVQPNPTREPHSTESWLLTDKQGHLWRHEKFGGEWIRCNAAGEPVDNHGHRVTAQHAERQNDDKMRSEAKVTPLNAYFNNPKEMFAEGMAAYREGITDRYELKIHNPQLYAALKRADQEEINRTHPPGKSGPTYVRDLDGSVVENTPEVHKRLDEFEHRRAL